MLPLCKEEIDHSARRPLSRWRGDAGVAVERVGQGHGPGVGGRDICERDVHTQRASERKTELTERRHGPRKSA
eukprot:scaffold87983_cov75-Phaeocystis_antarctica.AAC.7